jgi:hypothetical protein
VKGKVHLKTPTHRRILLKLILKSGLTVVELQSVGLGKVNGVLFSGLNTSINISEVYKTLHKTMYMHI